MNFQFFQNMLFDSKYNRLIPWFYFAALMSLFLLCLPAYWHSYFYYDDFNCFYLAQKAGGSALLGHTLNPFSEYFRPLYMLIYWVFWKFFFLVPLPYHLFSWALHLACLAMVFRLLWRCSGSAFAAGLVGLFYAYQLTFREIFFNFTCLGEPLCTLFMLAGLHLYFFKRESRSALIASYLLYFLALKTKELAITFPVILCLFEIMLNGDHLRGFRGGASSNQRRLAWQWLHRLEGRLAIPIILTALYLAIKIPNMGQLITEGVPYSPQHAYFLNFSFLPLLKGYAWYWNVLLGWRLPLLGWLLVWGCMAGYFLWRRDRWGLFWLAFVFIAFVPVIGMVNRRLPYYWYFPFLGVAGMGSLLIARLQQVLSSLFHPRWLAVAGMLLMIGIGVFQWKHQTHITKVLMIWVDGLTAEHQRFVQTLQILPPPARRSFIYFDSLPSTFDPTAARSSVQVLFRDTTLKAPVVPWCPKDAPYCLAVKNGQVIPKRWPGL
jgi:hypothetical protein